MLTLSDTHFSTEQPLPYFSRPVPDLTGTPSLSESDILQHMAEVESSRRRLDRCSQELARLTELSANAVQNAQRAAQSKCDLLATVSHELRTPLNGILGMTSLLLARNLPPVEKEYVEVIRQSGEMLLATIDDILDLSKMEAERLELESTEISPRDVVKEAVRIVSASAAQKNLTLITETDDSVPAEMAGDALRMRQILLNLLSNAIKFTDAGTITVRTEKVVAGTEASLRFTVADCGIGISPEGQSRLFQPFSQADSSISRRFGGTGLGLAICKRLAEMMGGSIGVQSQLGAGSSFWFTVRATAMKASAAATPELPRQLSAQTTGRAADVLLVEDNAINQKVAALMLTNLGHTVTVASGGVAAVDALSERPYDVVLMDCQMPELDGFAATRAIRENGSQVPIIAMTAHVFEHERDACFCAGMNDHLPKPISEGSLRAAIDRWFTPHHCAEAARA